MFRPTEPPPPPRRYTLLTRGRWAVLVALSRVYLTPSGGFWSTHAARSGLPHGLRRHRARTGPGRVIKPPPHRIAVCASESRRVSWSVVHGPSLRGRRPGESRRARVGVGSGTSVSSPREARRARGQSIGRPKALDASKAALAQRMHAGGESAGTIAAALGVSRATVYRVLAEQVNGTE